MDFTACVRQQKLLLMEGALGERLKREFGLKFDPYLDMGALVYSEEGRNALETLWQEYRNIAARFDVPFLATTPTRRINRERLEKTGYTDAIIRENVSFLREIQKKDGQQMYIGGLLGCRGDAYTGKGCLSQQDALAFHRWETVRFADAGVDFLYAALMPTQAEAAGMALAIRETGLPCILSLTLQENGCLPDGILLADAMEYIDNITDGYPVCYMTNCVHPSIVRQGLMQPGNRRKIVKERFWGIQANTSALPYAQLDGAWELKTSEPEELAEAVKALSQCCPLKILGGCCGTDGRHMEAMVRTMTGA